LVKFIFAAGSSTMVSIVVSLPSAAYRCAAVMTILFIITILLFVVYAALLVYYRMAWQQLPAPAPLTAPSTTVTVIIPARNEEAAIGNCLESIVSQGYPAHLLQIIVADDFSTDGTADIVRSFADKNVQLLQLGDVVTNPLNSYKKKAIELAIAQSTGQLIITTDADCTVPPLWLHTIVSFYQKERPAFIAAPVSINCSNRAVEIFQALDFMTLQGITGASVHKKIHTMCNGANLAYERSVFYEVNGFKNIDHIASGDDMLLMHKIYERYPERVLFLKSKDAIVHTEPVHTIRQFFNQRIRWASKADKYTDKRIFPVLLLVYLFNALMLVLPITAVFANTQYPIPNPQHPILNSSFLIFNSPLKYWLLLLTLKTLIELYFLYPVATFFNKTILLWLFPLAQPFHIIYTVIAGWLGKFGNYTWKGRNVK
jgi:cellulose synthase/poly-beta-1,6-N-acetylglucosamine synthase-like glycosyltransferase